MSIIRDKFRYIFIYKYSYYLGTENSALFSLAKKDHGLNRDLSASAY